VTTVDALASSHTKFETVAPEKGRTTDVVGGALFTVTTIPVLVPLIPPTKGGNALQYVSAIRHIRGVPLGKPTIRSWGCFCNDLVGHGSTCDFILHLLTPEEAVTTSSCGPEAIVLFDGMMTAVLGAALFRLSVTPELVPGGPPGKLAALWSV
jgi:hypothetical protein